MLNNIHIRILVIFLLNVVFAFADCNFAVSNYSSYPVVANVGFFAESSATLELMPKSTGNIKIKSTHNCLDINKSGLGIAYINLGNNVNIDGGWVYAPDANIYRALGSSRFGLNGVLVNLSNGRSIILKNMSDVSENLFQVQIMDAKVDRTMPYGKNY